MEIADERPKDLEELRSRFEGFLRRLLPEEVGMEGIAEVGEDELGDFNALFSVSVLELLAAN